MSFPGISLIRRLRNHADVVHHHTHGPKSPVVDKDRATTQAIELLLMGQAVTLQKLHDIEERLKRMQ